MEGEVGFQMILEIELTPRLLRFERPRSMSMALTLVRMVRFLHARATYDSC